VGDVVLITGDSAGIGQACAERLHGNNWTVIGASRRGTSSGEWTSLTMDVDSDQSVSAGIASLVADHGRVDALVACAGWGLAGAAEVTPVAEAKEQLETNFWGAVRVVNGVLPTMRAQGRGRIVLMSSIGGIVGIPFQAFYSASKFALEGYGESLAYEVAPFGIDVTLVEPGNIRTEFTSRRRDVEAPDDPYDATATKAIHKMEQDEIRGAAPGTVAEVVERVLTARRPPRRASVGKMDERIGILAKRLLPYRLFEKGAKGSLGV
jgi:NAD(P)-dependent dehydrogenase (short-subunit alcohol dehydrogenase family)